MGNNAVNVNTYYEATQDITEHGSDWLWACFAIMLLSALVTIVWAQMLPQGQRVFHQLGVIILVTASVAYFCLASALGRAAIPTEFAGANGFAAGTTRSIWYVRYIDWTITTPALLLELLLGTGLPLSDILTVIFFDLVMIITGLVGALIPSSYKWGLFAFAMAAEVYIWFVLLGPGRKSVSHLGGGFKRAYTISACILSFLWLLYPIAWGLADGGNVITADSEMVFYGVLDVLAKPGFLFIHLFLLSKEDLSRLQLQSGKYSDGANAINYTDREKVHAYDNPPHVGPRAADPNHPAVKKGMFGRKGKYDATANPVTEHSAVDAAPRRSEAATVVSN
jgi:bacteriorhodopsin